jgi:hypothetical protein
MQLYNRLVSDDHVHVIDDFYQDLTWLDSHLKNATFKSITDANYAGLQSVAPIMVEETQKRFELILGEKLSFLASDGVIRVQRQMDENQQKTFIHFDLNRINALIYLSDPPIKDNPEIYGTHFYQHLGLKKKRFISLNSSKDDFQRKIVYEDTRQFNAWSRWLTVPFKRNRALIFDGNLYHSTSLHFFGDGPENGRLTQNFFPKKIEDKKV